MRDLLARYIWVLVIAIPVFGGMWLYADAVTKERVKEFLTSIDDIGYARGVAAPDAAYMREQVESLAEQNQVTLEDLEIIQSDARGLDRAGEMMRDRMEKMHPNRRNPTMRMTLRHFDIRCTATASQWIWSTSRVIEQRKSFRTHVEMEIPGQRERQRRHLSVGGPPRAPRPW